MSNNQTPAAVRLREEQVSPPLSFATRIIRVSRRLFLSPSSHLLEGLLYASLPLAFQLIAVWTYSARRGESCPPKLFGIYFYAKLWGVLTLVLIIPRLRAMFVGLCRSFRSSWPIYAVLLIYVFCRFLYLDLIPRWDAGAYFSWTQRLVRSYDGSLATFVSLLSLGSHVSHVPAMYWAIGQMLSPENHVVANVQNLLWASASILCFWLLLARVFHSLGVIERGLLLAAFSFNPLLFATSMTINLDYSLVLFELLALVGFVYGRPVTFLVAALGLCLSKETGVALYGLLLGGLFLFFLARGFSDFSPKKIVQSLQYTPSQGSITSFRSVARALIILLCLPVPVFLCAWLRPPAHVNRWGAETMRWNTGQLLSFGFDKSNILRVLGHTFILNFSWVELLIVLVAVIVVGCRRIFRKKTSQFSSNQFALINTIWLLLIGFLTLHCLYINYGNPRYVAPIAPLLLLLTGSALLALFRSSRIRSIVLGGLLIAYLAQNWRTVDPVSRYVVPVYSVGETELLDFSGGLQSKADGMVYNTQFANIQKVYEKVSKRIFANGARPAIVWGFNHSWLIFFDHKIETHYPPCRPLIDSQTLGFTMNRARGFLPTSEVFHNLDVRNAPTQAVYIHLPWIDNEASVLEHLKKIYRIAGSFEETSGGFLARAYLLEHM
jgi:hypothetical protein